MTLDTGFLTAELNSCLHLRAHQETRTRMTLPRFKPPPVVLPPSDGVERQGSRLVKRHLGKIEAATSPLTLANPKNWRKQAHEITNGGVDLLKKLYDIAMGVPFSAKLENGNYTEPEVPSLDTQRAAAKDLFEFINGKAVAQTEVLRAEKEAEDVEQYRALSDEQLNQFLERVREGEEDAVLIEEGEKSQ